MTVFSSDGTVTGKSHSSLNIFNGDNNTLHKFEQFKQFRQQHQRQKKDKISVLLAALLLL